MESVQQVLGMKRRGRVMGMIGRRLRNVLIAVVVIGGFCALWLTMFTDDAVWESRIIDALWALMAIGLVVNVFRSARTNRSRHQQEDAAPFDAMQGMYQGRKAPTYYQESVDDSSQITEAPALDPLKLPDDARRHDRT